ncbi:universal stress protein [Thalassobius vesicularis]|uniref:Universal stress protein n=1 Tax=Thalassobius vesicularis TaxID=1294297 RepID=A0A4S3M8P9_9RHOB|nr:universal stress protein [Thalassobius vesicularis]THD73406.1 universal stress protein [Thalassobius vesicularis]
MTKHIVVATDLSPRADRAVARAVLLAREHGARLSLLHVLDDAMPDDVLRHIQPRTTEHLERFAASAAKGLDYKVLPCVGDPTETLLDWVGDLSPSLLVLGTHRPRTLMDGLRETTSQRVVRLTNCPVLVVKERADQPYDTILAATDFSPSATAALNLGHALAPKAAMIPVHALYLPYEGLAGHSDQARHALHAAMIADAHTADAQWRAGHALPVTLGHTQFPTGGAWMQLNRTAHESRAQLITAGAHGRAGAHRALLGSLATDLLRDPPCDVLIARA